MKLIVLTLLCIVYIQIGQSGKKITFENFQLKHNKTYKSISEQNLHEQIFNKNLEKIQEHNSKYEQGLVSYEMGVNQFSDLSEDELSSKFKTWDIENILLGNKVLQNSSDFNISDLPESIDWRESGIVTPIKDQGNCGACWAFSATGSLEGQYALKYNLTSLSEQQLVDCDTTTNKGCDGGLMQSAIEYVSKYGIATEQEYPYLAVQNKCRRNKAVAVTAEGYISILENNETDLKIAVGLKGPVSVAVNALPITNYKTGIFADTCSDTLNHGVLVVGYGKDNVSGQNYWLIKNSWGTDWGEDGYYRIAMGKGLCGIGTYAGYPYGVSNSSSQNYIKTSVIIYFLKCIIIYKLFFFLSN